MYQYDAFDRQLLSERVAEFSDQVDRRLSGALSEDQFRPLRLMNGLYLEMHAYMMRVAIPYGVLSSRQLRGLARVARTWDKGYGHFTTRQNIQFNWPRLTDVPAILGALAEVEMHAIQTSGACIRNVTIDPFAGVAGDEIADPRPWAEILRQWSTLHPEFTFLPRKFKIAISGAEQDRAAVRFHDIGLRLVRDAQGALGFRVWVGGGLGRTPRVARELTPFIPARQIVGYLEAALRVYNLHGRRDNKYKARIKILVDELGIDAYRAQVEAEWQAAGGPSIEVPEAEVERISAFFAPPDYPVLADATADLERRRALDAGFDRWVANNVMSHRVSGHAAVTITLKPTGGVPGDVTAEQMDTIADLADRYSHGELRATKEQNLVLPHVRQDQLHALWAALRGLGLEAGTKGRISDMISCPGQDYCSLANARSIPLAQEIGRRFADRRRADDLGPVSLNVSGCINACGHHHIGNIGILGVDKRGAEAYQLLLGGDASEGEAAVGQITGRAMTFEEAADAVEVVTAVYLDRREPGETFIQAFRRLGVTPFKEALDAAR